MIRFDKIIFFNYMDSQSKDLLLIWLFVVALVLGTVHIVEAAQSNDNINLSNRNQIERFVSESEGIGKIIERELIFDTLSSADGKMEVIVTLDSPDRTAKNVDWMSQSSRQMWQADVSNTQIEVFDSLNTSDIDIRTVYENFPCFYAAVNSNALTNLMRNPRVKYIEPVRKLKRCLRQGIPLMNAHAVRSASGGAGVAIAILDSGVDYTHPQLGNGSFPNSKVIGGTDTAGVGDSNPHPGAAGGHGTACAGIAAGDRQPTLGDYIGGVAPGAKIIAVKVFPDDEETDASINDVEEGIDWCITNQYLDSDNPILVIEFPKVNHWFDQ